MKKKIKISKGQKGDLKCYPLVEVTWHDIVSDSGWQEIDEFLKTKLAVCVTKGHLLTQKNGITRIFGDYNIKNGNKDDIEDLANTTIIPNSVIISIKKI
jgi:hypothetical protein